MPWSSTTTGLSSSGTAVNAENDLGGIQVVAWQAGIGLAGCGANRWGPMDGVSARVAGYPGFGVLLARWSDHRKVGSGALSSLAGIRETELRAVFEGGDADPSLLRRLAPAMNLHTADLFAIAGVAVPEDLAPLDATAGGLVPQIARHAMCLVPEHRSQLRALVRSLPQESRTHAVPALRVYERYEPGFGAVLVHMLANRNLDWMGSARVLAYVTDLYWSGATVGAVGHGRKELNQELLARFATVLGMPADDLAALAGIEQPDGTPPRHPAAADVAELIWDVRRLTADQLRHVAEAAESLE